MTRTQDIFLRYARTKAPAADNTTCLGRFAWGYAYFPFSVALRNQSSF